MDDPSGNPAVAGAGAIVRPMRLLPIVVLAATSLAACGDDANDGGAATSAPSAAATECAPAGTDDPSRTVRVQVDDLVGGFGGLGTRTPSDLAAGPIRISVEADADNESPIDVIVSKNGTEVIVISAVAAGLTCSVDLTVEPGRYDLTDGTQNGGFDVVAGAPVTS